VGEGDEKARLEDLVRRQDGAPVRFHPWQTREALQEILAQATVAVVAIPPDIEQYVASSPLKLAEALALGRPILASELPATDLVRERGVGIQARHERGAYASAIRAFDRDSIERFVATRASSPDLGQANLPPAVFAPVAEWIGGRRSPRTSRGAAVQTP
jgi:glycosyltransferase involved in cell wall biosynthesis